MILVIKSRRAKDQRVSRFSGFYLIIITFYTLFIAGCGLPDFSTLVKPIVISNTGSATILGFTTPNPDPGTQINGYVIYYKIYTDFTDFSDKNDEWFFDENKYDNDIVEMPPGNIIPIERGFVRAGEFGDEDITNQFNIQHTNPGDNIIIDFNYSGVTDSNTREEPVAGIGPDPKMDPNAVILARGFIDPRYTNIKLRRFVNDWFFSLSDSDFHDGDLRRPPGTQPGTGLGDFTGDPILKSVTSHGQFLISFTTYSIGIDTLSSPPTLVVSKPVYLGNVEFTSIQLNLNRSSES